MAQYKAELPNDLIQTFDALSSNTQEILEHMTEAGAKVVLQNIRSSVPSSWLSSEIMRCLKITKPYKTPSDGGINTKVAFYGYFYNKNKVRTPAPLVANVTEYGRSNSPYPKHPFMRKAFNKGQILKAMTLEQQRQMERYVKMMGFSAKDAMQLVIRE